MVGNLNLGMKNSLHCDLEASLPAAGQGQDLEIWRPRPLLVLYVNDHPLTG